MATDRFFIAPYEDDSGLQSYYKPWLIPDQAFSELNNAYVFRGRVRKRFGSRWIGNNSLVSRLRINIGSITGGVLSGNLKSILADSGMPTSIGQSFSISNIIFTVYNAASGPQQMLRTDNSILTATYDLTTSNFNITNVALPDGTLVYFYPNLPVMGLPTFEQSSINNEYPIAFDTRYAYVYSTGSNFGWDRISSESTAGSAVWTGTNSQFFWGDTWFGTNGALKIIFVTNFNQNEPNFMRYYDGTQWYTFNPVIYITTTPTTFTLNSARILVPFKGRLLALNTWEGPANSGPGTNYANRMRYSAFGNTLGNDSWRRDIPGQGGGLDAPITEAIITVEFVKDRLIVFFERSTWEVVYTNNQVSPFAWQQINTELGAESTFSIVPFDKVCIGVGNVGIHACNGSNVERIDDNIPETIFQIHNADNGVIRVYGIRDYHVEMVYWTFPSIDANSEFPYPNRVLIYNYITKTWAFNDDSITAFGYFKPIVGITWDSTTVTWDSSETWDSGSVQALFRQVIGGNQQGYTFICDADEPTNAPVIQITNITLVNGVTTITSIQHNIREQDNVDNNTYIYIQDAVWSDASNSLNGTIFQVVNVIDANNFQILGSFTGIYMGGGLISRVSNISIKTKEYNFYAKQGRNAYISKVDFMVDSTAAGQTQVDFYVSTALTPLLEDSAGNGVLLGTGTLDTYPYPDIPFEATATRLWHPVYFQADGEIVQFWLVMNDLQMRNINVMNADFALHAMCIFAQPTSYHFR